MKLAYPVATPEVKAQILGCSLPIDEACAGLRAAGYSGIEPFVCDPARFDAEAWLNTVTRHGLEIAAVGTGPAVFDEGLSFTAAAAHARRRAVERAKAIVDFAALCRAQVNIGKLRGDVLRDRSGDARRWMREAFAEVCGHAAAKNVVVTLEPQNRTVVDNLNTTPEALAWLETQATPNLHLLLDVFHLDHEGENPAAALALARPHLGHIHFSDTERRLPGQGRIDFAPIVAQLRAVDYARFITIEAKPEPDCLSAARQAAAHLLPLISTPCASVS